MHSISITTLAAAARKRFSKQELFEELAWFMPAFAKSVERMYGTGAAVLMRSADVGPYKPSLQELQSTPLWQSLSQLYDYGVHGIIPTINDLGDGSLADVEMFVVGLDGLAMYLDEDEGGIPKLSKKTVALGHARHILDGGVPYTDVDTDRPSDYLTFAQVALLADLDERSMRNCVDPSNPDPLKTVCSGNRTYIHIEEAKRWLGGRERFVPTGTKAATPFNFAKTFEMDLPVDVLRALNDRAAASGVTPVQVFRIVFADEISHDSLYAANAQVAAANDQTERNREEA
jgi:hypothetical protein